MPQPGDLIARYKLIRLLGKGGMGEVWLVEDTRDSQHYALKLPTNPDFIKQLRREGKLQKALEHPRIVKVLDLEIAHDPPFILMEYIKGRNLRDVLRKQGPMSLERAARLVLQILEAAGEAHRHGVVHRDIKPANILLEAATNEPKILDFGIGKITGEMGKDLLASGSLLTSGGDSIAGTYDYMSAEQKSGENVGPDSDLYAIGLIFFETLSAARPIGSLRRILERRGVPASVIDVIARATDVRENRYADAETFKNDIEAALALPRVEPPETKPKEEVADSSYLAFDAGDSLHDSSEEPRVQATAARAIFNAKLAAAIAGGLCIAAVAIFLFITFLNRPTPSPPPPVEPKNNSQTVNTHSNNPILSLASVPAGAQIAIDGVEIGQTPWEVKLRRGESQRIEVYIDGHVAWTTVTSAAVTVANRKIELRLAPAPYATEWIKTFGEAGEECRAIDLKQTSDGGIIVIGTRETDKHYLMKTDSDGALLWEKDLKDYDSDSGTRPAELKSTTPRRIELARRGGYLIQIEHAYGTVELGARAQYLLETDSSGDQRGESFLASVSGHSENFIHMVLKTAEGDYLAVGAAQGEKYKRAVIDLRGGGLRPNWQASSHVPRPVAGYDAAPTGDDGFIVSALADSSPVDPGNTYLIKLDANGNILFEKPVGGRGAVGENRIAETPDDGYIIAGQTPGEEAYLIKADASGDLEWERVYSTGPAAFLLDADGGFVLAADTLVKISPAGERLWQVSLTAPDGSTCQASAIIRTRDGAYLAAGRSGGKSALVKIAPLP